MKGELKTSGYYENDKEIGVTIDPQESKGSGVVCPNCGLAFIVMAINQRTNIVRSIPLTGKTNYFCPACGKNLKEYIAEMIKAG